MGQVPTYFFVVEYRGEIMKKGNIPEELIEFIREEAEKLAYEVVDISSGGGQTLFMNCFCSAT